MIKNSACVSQQEIVILPPVSLFFNKILFIYSQNVGLKIFGKKKFDMINDKSAFIIDYIENCEEKKCPKSTFLVISHQGNHLKHFPTKSCWTII